MEETRCTILFDGQFWIALVEKTGGDGTVSVGKYTFGSEPANTEVREFLLYRLASVRTFPSPVAVRIKTDRSRAEQDRTTRKSRDIYKDLQKEYFAEKKKQLTRDDAADRAEKFRLKKEKKKQKRRGH
ncbi:DUF2992 family protein [Breznakiella homolactica]|uniref:DUF2992 family protein n=1 Tax=Breznakiella homolactica TaxID=2798577 RepID=A0A7T8BBC1_9SPIR|nr:DUF2992 family protein [Breznakiella homolactica]QQO10251.1 YjdF family protein [Breznakiella homolactica]